MKKIRNFGLKKSLLTALLGFGFALGATQAQALEVANEVEALYTNGPAGGGGASKTVREVIAAASMLMPRAAIQTKTVLLDISAGEV